ncbi:MAG: nitrate ABC transporter substrate-binding protein [Deltaproteobacteria bacterium]|nr:MAG: nitrate ABC transporter substrate-binding protein [Deltaproteobacteria bacterium]RLC12240.1 MAG: nitrate ABC transporter substrate-binding protein [Deltaproteobacteria bacterium]
MNRHIKKLTAFLFLIAICFSLLFSLPGIKIAEASEDVTYRLKWLFNASVIGDIYADVHGHFKAQGLDVTIKEGGPERDAIRELELGYAEFGVASADQVIRALAKGSPVVVIAQLFQVNPLQWIYRTENLEITRVEDLKGKVVGITFGGNDETIMRTLMAKAGVTEKDISIFSVRYDYTPFYQKRVDVWPVYRNSQAPILEKKLGDLGESVAYFNPAAYGVKFVANSVVTSRRMMEAHPDVVEKFTRALLQGWEDALDPDNEEQALKTLRKFDKDTASDIMRKQLVITRSLIKPFKDTRIGAVDLEAWQQTEKIMLEQKQIPGPVGVEKVIR